MAKTICEYVVFPESPNKDDAANTPEDFLTLSRAESNAISRAQQYKAPFVVARVLSIFAPIETVEITRRDPVTE